MSRRVPLPSELPKAREKLREHLRPADDFKEVLRARRRDQCAPWPKAEPTKGRSVKVELLREHNERIATHAVYEPRLQNQAVCERAITGTVAMMRSVGASGVYVRIQDNQCRQFVPFEGAPVEVRNAPPELASPWRLRGSEILDEPVDERDFMLDFLEMLHATLSEFAVSDCEFILNLSPLPVVASNGTSSPLFHVHDCYSMPLPPIHQADPQTSHGRLPVLSGCTRDGTFADLLIPREYAALGAPPKVAKWEDRTHLAIFRGPASGPGTAATPNSATHAPNQRLILANLSYKNRVHPKNKGLLDAAITDWHAVPRKSFQGRPEQIDPQKLAFKLAPAVDMTRHRIAVAVDGEGSDPELWRWLLGGYCILAINSGHSLRCWLWDGLREYEHYVPVRADLSDLFEQLHWCEDHPEECRVIAENALAYARVVLRREYLQKYLATVLNRIAPDEVIPQVDSHKKL